METVTYTLKPSVKKYIMNINIEVFQKADLEKFTRMLKKCIERAPYKVSEDSNKSVAGDFEKIMRGEVSMLKKENLVRFLSSFYIREANMTALISAAFPDFKKAWARLVSEIDITVAEMEKIIRQTLTLISSNSWQREYLVHPLLFGVRIDFASWYFRDKLDKTKTDIWLTSGIRKTIAERLFPDLLKPHTSKSLPEGYEVMGFSRQIASEILMLDAYAAAHELLGTSENVSLAKIKSMMKKVKVEEFPDYEKTTMLSRQQMVGLVFISMLLHNRRNGYTNYYNSDRETDLAKYIVNDMGRELGVSAYKILFPYYEGFTKSVIKDSRARHIINYVNGLLKQAAAGWLDMSNFKLRYLTYDNIIDDLHAYAGLFSDYNYRDSMLRRSDTDFAPGEANPAHIPTRYWDDVTWGFVKAYIRLLIAAGVLDLALPELRIPVSSDEMLENSRVRLTGLGKFALGLTKEYTPDIEVNITEDLELDDRNMIATLLRQESPARIFIETYAEHIGGNRYHFSAPKMVASSANAEEGRKRINNLEAILKPEPGSNWARLLEECRLRLAARRSDPTEYILVNLNPATPGLIRFINTSPEILRNVIRTEDARLLVPSDYYDVLCKLLRKEGYLIE